VSSTTKWYQDCTRLTAGNRRDCKPLHRAVVDGDRVSSVGKQSVDGRELSRTFACTAGSTNKSTRAVEYRERGSLAVRCGNEATPARDSDQLTVLRISRRPRIAAVNRPYNAVPRYVHLGIAAGIARNE
jgi:hypothetical protein